MLMGVIDAAEEAKSPVIISFGTGFVGNTSFEDFSHMMVSMAQKATVGSWSEYGDYSSRLDSWYEFINA